MESSLLEIVELENGEIVLRRADSDDQEPLLNIRFAKKPLGDLPELRIEIAKAMIQAGIQTFTELAQETDLMGEKVPEKRVVH